MGNNYVKGIVHPKILSSLSHTYLFTREDILKSVGNQAADGSNWIP